MLRRVIPPDCGVMNVDKTECVLFGAERLDLQYMGISDKTFQSKQFIKFLGVRLSQCLKWQEPIDHL